LASKKTNLPANARISPPRKSTRVADHAGTKEALLDSEHRARMQPATGRARTKVPLPTESAVLSATASISRQVSSAATGLLSLSKGVVSAARGLQLASAAARAIGSGSSSKAARLVWDALGPGPSAGARKAAEKAGQLLKELREAAGLTLDDVNAALGLGDPTLLREFESGKLAVPFELILRLAAIVGRNDPVGFVMKLTRAANPDLWKSLEGLGIGRLVLQSAREREFANVLRADDAARRLTDEEFALVLTFVKAAFELAMAFRGRRA
jgi:transcriptional regulator with XRE-family HTH domain